VPLGDGDEKDTPASLCLDVVNHLPHCMDLITAAKVIEAIESYFETGQARDLEPGQATKVKAHARRSFGEMLLASSALH
jgi:hypothetical protein